MGWSVRKKRNTKPVNNCNAIEEKSIEEQFDALAQERVEKEKNTSKSSKTKTQSV